jgi:hypothetical protein
MMSEYLKLRESVASALLGDTNEHGLPPVEAGFEAFSRQTAKALKSLGMAFQGATLVEEEFNRLFGNLGDHGWELTPVDQMDLVVLSVMLGAQFQGWETISFDKEILSFDQAGNLVVGGRKAIGPVLLVQSVRDLGNPVVVNTAVLSKYQAAAYVMLLGARRGLSSALKACDRFLIDPEQGFIDADRKRLLDGSLRVVEVELLGNLLEPVEKTDRLLVNSVVRELLPNYRVRASKDSYAPFGKLAPVPGFLDVPTVDEAKGVKRADAADVTQCRPVNPELCALSYQGTRGTGVLLDVLLAPCGLATLTGFGDGTAAVLSREFGDKAAFHDPFVVRATSFAVKSQEDCEKFMATIPKVGEELVGSKLSVHGAPTKLLPLGKKLVTGVSQATEDPTYGNIRWEVRGEAIDRSGDGKLRGLLKAMTVFPAVKIHHGHGFPWKELTRNELVIALPGNVRTKFDLLAGMACWKGSGKGSGKNRVETAVQTFKRHLTHDEFETHMGEVLPAEGFDADGTPRYDETVDVGGGYSQLVQSFEEHYAVPLRIGRLIAKDLWSRLLDAYLRQLGKRKADLEWEPTPIGGQAASLEIMKGITGKPEVLTFVVLDDGRTALVQQTTAFTTAMVLKVEHTSVARSVSIAHMMLDAAIAFKALGHEKTARYLEEQSRTPAKGVERLFDLVNGHIPVSHRTVGLHPGKSRLLPEGTAMLKAIIESDLETWPADLCLSAGLNEQEFCVDRTVLATMHAESPQRGAVKGLIEAALGGDLTRFQNNFRTLRAALHKMLSAANKGFFKKLMSGPRGSHAKRVPITSSGAAHDELQIHPKGQVWRNLETILGEKMVDGQYVLLLRAPMKTPSLLRVKSSFSVGVNKFAVSEKTASSSRGDFDGEGVVVVPLSQEAVEELLSANYSAWELSLKAHSIKTGGEFHWEDANLLIDGKHNVWGKAKRVSIQSSIALDEGTIRAYRMEMPGDANKATMALMLAAMGKYQLNNVLGLLFEVWEAELGGYDPKFADAHKAMQIEDPIEREEEFLKACAKLNFTEEFGRAWLSISAAKTSTMKALQKGYLIGEHMTFRHVISQSTPADERSMSAWMAIAFAMKLLSSGEINNELMLNLDIARVENWVVVGKDRKGKDIQRPTGESYDLAQGISFLWKQGHPAATRLQHWMMAVLPRLRELSKEKSYRAFSPDMLNSSSEED